MKGGEKTKRLKSKKLNKRLSSSSDIKKKSKKEVSSVNLLRKNSNGVSNWDNLCKVLGFNANRKIPIGTTTKTEHNPKSKDNSCNPSILEKRKGNRNKHMKSVKLLDDHIVMDIDKSNELQHTTNSAKDIPGAQKKSRPLMHNNSIDISQEAHSSNETKEKLYAVETKNKYEMLTGEINFPRKRESNKGKRHVDFKKNTKSQNASENQTSPHQMKKLTHVVAMDCEMVGTGYNGEDSMIARVSLVNRYGDCIYDAYVTPKDDITDYRTHVSGIRPSDLVNGKDLYTVQKEVLDILKDRVLVGHSIKHDLDVLFISHPKTMIRDTSKYRPFRQLCDGRTPSLKKLAARVLGTQIQTGEHNSIEDAQATMQIYLMHKAEWENRVKYLKKRRANQRDRERSNSV